jgi:hypothetical protein
MVEFRYHVINFQQAALWRRDMVEFRYHVCLRTLLLYKYMLIILQQLDKCAPASSPKNCWPQAAIAVKPLSAYHHCQFYSWTPASLRAAVTVAEASSRVLAFFTVLNASTTSPSSHSSKSSTPIPHSSPAPTCGKENFSSHHEHIFIHM